MRGEGISPATEGALKALAAAGGRDFELCPRCRCCEVESVPCYQCGGAGVDGHECGELAFACLDPEENVPCDICDGAGHWRACLGRCDEHGVHRSAARRLDRPYSDVGGGKSRDVPKRVL